MIKVLVSGAVSGAIYSLIASGLVLTYSATGVFNIGYGAVAFTSAFLFYELNSGLGWNRFIAALFVVLIFAPVLGLVLDRVLFRPLAKASDAAKIVCTVGLLIALPALARFLVERGISLFHWNIPDGKQVFLTPGVLFQPTKVWKVNGVFIDSNQLLVFITAAICAIGLWLFSLSPLGLRMRAVVDRAELAQLRGVNETSTLRLATVLGTVLAGAAGVVGAPVLNSLDPFTYATAVFVASTAAIIGGLRSVPRAFAGGLITGILMSLTFRYVTVPGIRQLNNAIPFVLLLGGLLLLGKSRVRAAGTSNLEPPPMDWNADLPRWRQLLPWVIAGVWLAVWMAFVLDDFWRGLFLRGLGFSLILLSITIVTGHGGLVSLAQGAFATGAALTVGLLHHRYDVPLGVAVLGGVAAAAALGVIVALPALRLGGLHFTLATLALAFLASTVLFDWTTLTNGDQGWKFTRPDLAVVDLESDTAFGLVLIAVIVLVVFLIGNMERSATGRGIASVRVAESAAGSIGISPVTSKLRLFVFSAIVAGAGGVTLALIDGGVTRTTTTPLSGLTWLTVVVLLGVRRRGAAVIGGMVLIVFPQLLSGGFHLPSFLPAWSGTRSNDIPAILFGLGAASLARKPDGAMSDMAHQRYLKRLRRRTGAPVQSAESFQQEATVAAAVPRRSDSAAIEQPLCELVHLRAGYGQVQVLHGIDLKIAPGTMTAVLGSNGAGKSTLCRALAGLTTTSGIIRFDGEDISSVSPSERANRGIIYAPESRGIFPGLSVEDNLRLALRDEQHRERAYERFPILKERRKLPAAMLSGGEQQMLSLAPVLVNPPRLLVIDEPTLGLAPMLVNLVMSLIQELRDSGIAVLIAEEKPKTVMELADQVVFINIGRVVWQGDATELTDDIIHRAYHLETERSGEDMALLEQTETSGAQL